MVKVAEEFIEAVLRWEQFIFIAQMVLTELSGRVTHRFKNSAIVGSFALKPMSAPGSQLSLGRYEWRLTSDKRRATRGATLLAIPAGEHRAFFPDAVDVRRLVPMSPRL